MMAKQSCCKISSETLLFLAKNTSSSMRKRNKFSNGRRLIMSVSTVAAGLVIIAGTALLKLLEKEDKNEKDKFENS